MSQSLIGNVIHKKMMKNKGQKKTSQSLIGNVIRHAQKIRTKETECLNPS